MPRYKLVVEYDGTPFVGWQRQSNGRSVQQAIEEAVAGFAGHAVRIQTAGRTDAGVHATHQVAHVDLAKEWPTDTVRDATNAHLKPEPVSILHAEIVPDTFNARMSARRRHYLYRILNRRAPAAVDLNRVWHVPWPLDADAMHAAAQTLVGRHDFTTFRAAECQADSPVRTLDRLDVDARRGGDPHRRLGALLPASSGALDGRHPHAGRGRALERRRGPRGARGEGPQTLRPDGSCLRIVSRRRRLLRRSQAAK